MQAFSFVALLLTSLTGGPARPTASASSSSAAVSSQPPVRSAEEVKSTVMAYLGSIDTPISDVQWRALGPSAVPVLEGIIDNKGALPSWRARSLGALAAASPERASARAQQLVQDESEHFAVRLAAVVALGRTLPSDALQAQLRPVLSNSRDVRVRARAAQVLAERGHDCASVLKQVTRETAVDREAFHSARMRCRSPAP